MIEFDKSNELSFTIEVDTKSAIDFIIQCPSKHKFWNFFWKKYLNITMLHEIFNDILTPFVYETVNENSSYIEMGYAVTVERDLSKTKVLFAFTQFLDHNIEFKTEEERNSFLSNLKNLEKITMKNILSQFEDLNLLDGIKNAFQDYICPLFDNYINQRYEQCKREGIEFKSILANLEDELLFEIYGVNGAAIQNNTLLQIMDKKAE